MTAAPALQVRDEQEFERQPEDYKTAVRKIVRSHAVNELYGAQVFDEPAIALAPTPYAKWLTCRVAMEEYGHHVRFRELGEKIGIPMQEMTPHGKKPLSIFEFPMKTWAEFCVIKLLADMAEIIQVEDLSTCSFHPLRNLARMTMPEERFHAQFGREFCTELCKTEEGRKAVQDAIDRYFPMLPAFFGRDGSINNAQFRRFGIKQRKNEEMRVDYVKRARQLVEVELGLRLPTLPRAA
ncbi:MAG: phenylacetate-CoA oxygenase subunit PaaI [Alphaproteobacteria bacterium]|nr:phenylacetate-CoA oxygenase subunit PaaI [Alphaproteobacteria bacterium]